MKHLILIFACAFSVCTKPPAHVSVSDKSIQKFADTIISKNWKVLSIGGFYHDKKVESLYLDLDYSGVMTDIEAEKMLSSYIRLMIRHINKDKALASYLIKKRFGFKDISLSLSYMSPDGKSSQMHLYDGEIVNSIYNKETNSLVKNYSKPIADLY